MPDPAERGHPLAIVAALAAGVVVATAAMVVSRYAWRPGPLTLPVGLVAGIGYSMVFTAGARRFGWLVGFAGLAGWLGTVFGTLSWNPGGDLLLAGDWFGYGFLLVGTVLVVLAGVRRPRTRRSTAP